MAESKIRGCSLLKSGGRIPTKKYITPNTKAENAKMSQVPGNPCLSQRAPPRIGPMIVPKEPAILNEAEALSLI